MVTINKKIVIMIRIMLMILTIILPANIAIAQKVLVNTDDGIALSGYDPVAFFIDKKPILGQPEIKSVNRNAIYVFSSKENKIKFDKAPDNYLPQNGGFCTVSASMGKVRKIQINTWSLVDNKLYLQRNQKAKGMWDKDPQKYIKGSFEKWPELVEKYGD
jgi:YHS domain-containing protein